MSYRQFTAFLKVPGEFYAVLSGDHGRVTVSLAKLPVMCEN